MSGGRIPQLRRAAVIVAALIVPLAGTHAVADAEGPGGSVDGSVTVAALVVTAVTPPATPPAAGDLVTVRVQVRNDLPRPVNALAVGITGAVTAGATVPTLAAGQTADVALPVWFCTAGPTIIIATATGLDGGSAVSAAPNQSTVAVGAGPGCPSDPSIDRFPIRVSAAADRSNPIPLDGRIVGGIIHVFVDPANPVLAATRINRVEFRLDGRALITENFRTVRPRPQPRVIRPWSRLDTAHQRHPHRHRRRPTPQRHHPALHRDLHRRQRPARQVDPLLHHPGSQGSPTPRRCHPHRSLGPTSSSAPPPASPTPSVYMFRNGRLIRVETTAPYDLGGTARNGDARPFTLTGLRRGTHTVTVEYRLPGGVTITQRASFTRP